MCGSTEDGSVKKSISAWRGILSHWVVFAGAASICKDEGHSLCATKNPKTTKTRLFEKVYRVLDSGGMVAVHDLILEENRTAPLFPVLFSLNMLTGTAEGHSYTNRELTLMPQGAGFTDVERLPYTGPTDSGMITAKKP